MKTIHFALIVAQLMGSLNLAHGAPLKTALQEKSSFSLAQQDQLILKAQLDTQPEGVYKFALISYSVHGAQLAFDQSPEGIGMRWFPETQSNSVLRPNSPLNDRTELMQLAADNRKKSFDGFSIEGTLTKDLISAGLGIGATYYLGPRGTLLVPAVVDKISTMVKVDPVSPTMSFDFSINTAAWGLDQVRRNTEAGKVLAKYLKPYGMTDPTRDRSSNPAITSAELLKLSYRSASDKREYIASNKSLAEILLRLESLGKASERTPQQREDPEFKEWSAETAKQLGHAADSFRTLGLVLALTGDTKEAQQVEKIAQVAKAAQMITAAQDMSGIAAVNIYVYAAVMIYTAIKISQEKSSPYDQLSKMLERITKQIESLRQELNIRLNQIDTKLSVFTAQSLTISQANFNDTRRIADILSRLTKQLEQLRRFSSEQAFALADLHLNEQDADCFRFSQGKLRPLSVDDFIKCRARYIDRGTNYARNVLAHDPTSSSAVQLTGLYNSVVGAARYENIRKTVDPSGAEYSNTLAHPNVWAASSAQLTKLVQNQPELSAHLDETGVGSDGGLLIDPLIEAGRDIRKFRKTLLVKDGLLRQDRIELYLKKLGNLQSDAILAASDALADSGTTIDVSRGQNQPFKLDFPYTVMAQPIPFCDGAPAKLESYSHFYTAGKGKGGGILYPVPAEIPNAPNQFYVGQMSEAIAQLKGNDLPWNLEILKLIPHNLLLLEQAGHNGFQAHACISNFTIRNFHQDLDTSFTGVLNFGLNIYVSDNISVRRTPILIRSLVAQINVNGGPESGAAQVLGTWRLREIMSIAWKNILPALLASLKDVETEQTAAVQNLVQSSLAQYIRAKQTSSLLIAEARLLDHQREFSEGKAELETMISAGLDLNQPQVSAFVIALHKALDGRSPIELAREIIRNSGPGASTQSGLESAVEHVNLSLKSLSEVMPLRYAPDSLSGVQQDLENLYWLRNTPPKNSLIERIRGWFK